MNENLAEKNLQFNEKKCKYLKIGKKGNYCKSKIAG